jgi:hypothetical protein
MFQLLVFAENTFVLILWCAAVPYYQTILPWSMYVVEEYVWVIKIVLLPFHITTSHIWISKGLRQNFIKQEREKVQDRGKATAEVAEKSLYSVKHTNIWLWQNLLYEVIWNEESICIIIVPLCGLIFNEHNL